MFAGSCSKRLMKLAALRVMVINVSPRWGFDLMWSAII
jgi:hypothetical protein